MESNKRFPPGSDDSSNSGAFSVTTWLIILIASIGFLFDTYELLMTPLAAPRRLQSY